ncbi:MAG: hypothetical protein R2932_03005 [Caldilineaceae bacterium]
MVMCYPDIQLKMGYDLVNPKLTQLADLSHYVSELANLHPNSHQPFVGSGAIARKGVPRQCCCQTCDELSTC